MKTLINSFVWIGKQMIHYMNQPVHIMKWQKIVVGRSQLLIHLMNLQPSPLNHTVNGDPCQNKK